MITVRVAKPVQASLGALREEEDMARKVLWLLGPVAVGGAAIAFGWTDMMRYIRMRQISAGHPELVPAEGTVAYPQDGSHAEPDGTGEFDSALRGGPTVTHTGSPTPGEERRT